MKGKNVMLQEDISGIEAIYGGGATLVRSQILLRVDISMDTPPPSSPSAAATRICFRRDRPPTRFVFWRGSSSAASAYG